MPRSGNANRYKMSFRDIFLGFCRHESGCYETFRRIIFKKFTRYKPEEFTEEGEWTDERLEDYFEILMYEKAQLELHSTPGGKSFYVDKPGGRGFINYVQSMAELPDPTLHAYFKNWVQNIVTNKTPKWYKTFYNAVVDGMRRDKFGRFARRGPKKDILGLTAWVGRIETITQRDYHDLLETWARMWKRNEFPRRTERKILCQERLHILKTMFDEIGEWIKAFPFFKAVKVLFPFDSNTPDKFGKPLDENQRVGESEQNNPALLIELREQHRIIQSKQPEWHKQLDGCFDKTFSVSKMDHYMILYLLLTGEEKKKTAAAKAVKRSNAFVTRTVADYKNMLAGLIQSSEMDRFEESALNEYVKLWLKKKINS